MADKNDAKFVEFLEPARPAHLRKLLRLVAQHHGLESAPLK